jgi:hypothetical protein
MTVGATTLDARCINMRNGSNVEEDGKSGNVSHSISRPKGQGQYQTGRKKHGGRVRGACHIVIYRLAQTPVNDRI